MENKLGSGINSTEQIRSGALMSYIGIFVSITTGLLYTPWMIQQIGQSEYGLYSLALTLISFFTFDFGLGEAVARFLSKYNVENNNGKKREFLGLILKIYIILDVVIFFALVIILILAGVIYSELTSEELSKFRIVFSIAALYSVLSFPFLPINGILISNERFVFQKLLELLNRIFTVLVMIIVLLLGYKLYSLVVVNAIIGIITIGVKLEYIYKNNIIDISFKSKDKLFLKEIFNFSIWSAIIGVAQRFILNITPTILGAFSGSIQISLFSIAMMLEGYTWIFANAINGLFLPKVTRMTTEHNNRKNIEDLMIKVGRIQFVLIGILLVGFLTMGKEFMSLWIGDHFRDAYYVTLLLIAPCIITLTQQIGNTALVALNEIKYRAFCSILAAVISVLLSIIFSRDFGAIGAGIAIFIGNLVGLVVGMNIVYYKVLKINILRFFTECHIKMCIPLLLSIGLGFLIQSYFPVQNLLLYIFKVCILMIIYLSLMWIFVLNRFEKNLFIGMFIKVFKMKRS